jgi:hypothetical protein
MTRCGGKIASTAVKDILLSSPDALREVIRALMQEVLKAGSPEIRQAYARMMIREVAVTADEIRINRSKKTLAHAASGGDRTPAEVFFFVRGVVRPRGIEPLLPP